MVPNSWRHPIVATSQTRLLLLAADLASFASFHAHHFARIANTLALIRLRLANRTNVGSPLPDKLLVNAGDTEPGVGFHGEGNALRRIDLHRRAFPSPWNPTPGSVSPA